MQLQNQQRHHHDGVVLTSSLRLPSKKRKETRDQSILPDPTPATFTVSTYSLPAKKRVWALPLDLVPEKPISTLDLNLEYKPDLGEELEGVAEKNGECTEAVCGNAPQKIEEDTGGEEENGDEDGVVCAVCKSTDGDPSDRSVHIKPLIYYKTRDNIDINFMLFDI